jgi:hypothetical protein
VIPIFRVASILLGLCVLPTIAMLPTAARGEEPDSLGSLTVVSRPSAAVARVRGDRTIVGRTPLTLREIPPGRYRVRVVDPAFERWERSITFDGMRDDTVWMSLRAKTRARAVLRSFSFPGWGQFYERRPISGWLYATATVVTFGASIAAQVEYSDRVHEADRATTLEDYRRAIDRAEDARKTRNLLQGGAAALWGLGLLDAAWRFPKFGSAPISKLEIAPRGHPAEGVRIAARVDF